MRYCFWLMAALLIGIAIGCGPRDLATEAVKGKVTFDGTAVAEGVIYFDNSSKSLPSVNAPIKNGDYLAKVVKGKYTVRVTAYKMEPLPPGTVGASGETEGRVQFLPPQFNEQTTLSADVVGAKELNFDLKSSPN